MNANEKVIDYIKNTAEYVRTEEGLVSASAMLERFLFPPSVQYSPIGRLSGGEKRRLYLLRVLMEAPNVLLLDEPTNDLDIETMTILEDYLDTFDGIVIMVSHDRYFLDRTAKRIFAFEENGKIRQYEGGYTEYALKKADEQQKAMEELPKSAKTKEAAQTKKKAKGSKVHQEKVRFTYKEAKEYAVIEEEIEALETKIEDLETKMGVYAADFVKLQEIAVQKEEAESQLEEKMQRWEYLEDLAQKIAGDRFFSCNKKDTILK